MLNYKDCEEKLDEFRNDPDCDPNFDHSYTGTNYEITKLELIGV